MPYLKERELSDVSREKLPARKFIFPKDKTWPIHDEEHGKIALTWSTWPKFKKIAKKVRQAVFKAFPKLKSWFKGGKYAKEAAEILGVPINEALEMRRRSIVEEHSSLGTLGSNPNIRERLEQAMALVDDQGADFFSGSRSFGDARGIVEDAEEAVLVTFGRHGHSLSGRQKDTLRGLLGRLAKEVTG